jgi:hypothetical protein
MQPFQRQLFICSAIEKCQETVNCCPHKQPHIKDERCVPRECRYAPGISNIDCDSYDPAHPRAPVPVPVAPIKTVEQKMNEKIGIHNGDTFNVTMSGTIEPEGTITQTPLAISKKDSIKHDDGLIPDLIAKSVMQDLDIKEAVKKAAQRPVTVIKKGGRKKA